MNIWHNQDDLNIELIASMTYGDDTDLGEGTLGLWRSKVNPDAYNVAFTTNFQEIDKMFSEWNHTEFLDSFMTYDDTVLKFVETWHNLGAWDLGALCACLLKIEEV